MDNSVGKTDGDRRIILASASPRRAQILTQLGAEFKVVASDCDENVSGITTEKIPAELANRKALAVSVKFPDEFVLGSDTLVYLPRENCETLILGKPKDAKDAFEMLKNLRNREHLVKSGVALAKNGKILFSEIAVTRVFFRNYADLEILNYLDTMEYADKAGSYGAQGFGARFIRSIDGCFYNVMGLPIEQTMKALAVFNRK